MRKNLPVQYINENQINSAVNNVIYEMKQQKLNEGLMDWVGSYFTARTVQPLLKDLAKKVGLREDGILYKWIINNKLVLTILCKKLTSYSQQQLNEDMFNNNTTAGAVMGGLGGLTSSFLLKNLLLALGFSNNSIFMQILNSPLLSTGIGAILGGMMGNNAQPGGTMDNMRNGLNTMMNGFGQGLNTMMNGFGQNQQAQLPQTQQPQQLPQNTINKQQ